MQIGVIGLGRMGGNISRRLMKAGHTCVVFDANAEPRAALAKDGATAVGSLAEVVEGARREAARGLGDAARRRRSPRRRSSAWASCWSAATSSSTAATPSTRTTSAAPRSLAEKGIRYVDCGTSGGVWGLERGYCMMIGGPKDAVDHLDPIFAALAPGLGDIPRTPGRERGDPRAEHGYIHAGPAAPAISSRWSTTASNTA